jgi:hypothetical protein
MRKDEVMNESPVGNAASEHAHEALKTRLRWRIRRAQRALNERAGVELAAFQISK